MNAKYLTALSALGTASVVALTFFLLPTPKAASPHATNLQVATPFKQVRIYRTENGGLLRTETLRWQGPGSMTIVTWTANGKQGAGMPSWVGIELQNMQAQQQLMAAAMQQMMGSINQTLHMAAPWGLTPQFAIPVELPQTQAPHVATPPPALMRHVPRTVDL